MSVTLKQLREKWRTVPAGAEARAETLDLLKLSDADIAARWLSINERDTLGEGRNVRGWYHDLYRAFMPGKRLLDIGCGFGVSTIDFARMGAHVTFTDITPENVELCRRACRGLGIEADFLAIDTLADYDRLGLFDVITSIGSLHHQPFDATQYEISRIVPHLKDDGRWLHLTYPKARWERAGSPAFEDWGAMTDGEGTPWAEWYDAEKLIAAFAPTQMRVTFECDYHDAEYNWFELERVTQTPVR